MPKFGAQTDSLPYTRFKDKLVLYTDFGFGSAPFSIQFKNEAGQKQRLKYRNNFRSLMGIGFSYKWMALRLGFALPGNLRPLNKFGRTDVFNMGLDFTIKKVFIDIDFRTYKGYAVTKANEFIDTLDDLHPNDIRRNTSNTSFSINTWYLHNKEFKIQPLTGKVGFYKREVRTFYIKSTLNLYGVNNSESLIPEALIYAENTKTNATSISAFDIGVLPGYAYVNRIKNWQFAGMFGLGPVLQLKVYNSDQVRSFLGLAPRYDLKFIGGYNVDRYFIMLFTEFDNKSIRFNDLQYRSSYYNIKLIGGYRFDVKKKSKKQRKK